MTICTWRPATGHHRSMPARPPTGGLAFCFPALPAYGREFETSMKLQLFFLLMDAIILLTYPIMYVVSKMRKLKSKR
jgi:hypothetical protein